MDRSSKHIEATIGLDERVQGALWAAAAVLESEADMWRTVASIEHSQRAAQRSAEIMERANLLWDVLRSWDATLVPARTLEQPGRAARSN